MGNGSTSKQRELPQTNLEPPRYADSRNRKLEIWPSHICDNCNRKVQEIRWEEATATKAATTDDGRDAYSGVKPCCIECGMKIPSETKATHQPPTWKQPILHTINQIENLSITGVIIENIFTTYHKQPREFLWATQSDLQKITKVGDKYATTIYTQKATLYPDHTPPTKKFICTHRGKYFTEIDPQTLANDLIVGEITPDDLPLKNPTPEQKTIFAQIAAVLDNMSVNTFYPAKSVEEVKEIISKLENR